MPDTRRQKADGLAQAIGLGLRDTWSSMVQVFQNLRGMITGRVSYENLGGPVMIAKVAYRIARKARARAVIFLAADGSYITGQQINVNGGAYM